jgi:8-oxo-dGTP pyrophosphatase MutT (NUDIX family)
MKAQDLKIRTKQGAGCLIFCRSTDRFLLILRSELVPVALTWSLPGGSVDPGETPEQAARREVQEEIGFVLEDNPLQLIYTNETHAPRFKFYTYAATVDKEFKPTLNWESAEYTWCDLDNLPSPLHWGMSQLLAFDRAAERLKKFVDAEKDKHSY